MKPGRNFVRENVPLSRFGVLVAQLESIVASAAQQAPDPLLCFDLLSDLIVAIEEEPKDSILLWQRKCEDALFALLALGARRPIRHLASIAMVKIISNGDAISIYSRASSLQGILSDGRKSEPQKVAGAAQCLGQLYRQFGRKITSGLLETTTIAAKLMKFNEEFVRQEALLMLRNALEGCGGSGASPAYVEAFRLITRSASGEKSSVVRIAAAQCLKAFANIGWPGLGFGELESSINLCVKALEDLESSVTNAFAEALGSLLALGMNPEAQVQPRGKGPFIPAKKLEGGLARHLALPFTKATGDRARNLRFGITLSWVFFLQAIRVKYVLPDVELQNYALDVLNILRADDVVDSHPMACVLYILRVGVIDQMTEPTQREFLVFFGKQLESPHLNPSMKIAVLRTLSYTLKSVGEVPVELKKACDDTVVAAVSHPSQFVRVEAAMTLQVLAEVDPPCVGGLISYGVTTIRALREIIYFEKGCMSNTEVDSLHGQAVVLAAMVHISPKLPLGYPSRFPMSIFEVSKKLLEEPCRNRLPVVVDKEAGWLLLASLFSSMQIQELESQVFDILVLWAALFKGSPQNETINHNDLKSRIRTWSAATEALEAFVRCFIAGGSVNSVVLLQPALVYLSSALEYILFLKENQTKDIQQELNVFIIRILRAYKSIPDPLTYISDHSKIIHLCSIPFRDAFSCEESSCLMSLLDKRDAWLGPWTPGRDWLEDELKAFQGGKDGVIPSLRNSELSFFPQPDTINKTLVNQMLVCFGTIFSSQNTESMLLLLGTINQSLKTGKKQAWHGTNVTNVCVGLLFALKALIVSHSQNLATEILNSAMTIFLSILAEGDICPSHRRAASEGLGLLARLGNDAFTVRMVRSLLNELNVAGESCYSGSIALALGCIHRCAGGMALSTLVPSTVNAISSLAKSAVSSVQLWSLHGLLLTIEAAGYSYVTNVQTTLSLAMDILLSGDDGFIDVQQGVGRLVNAIVAVLGPELAPGSIFFSRCKSVIAEISSQHDTANLLESVRFTQHLVLFAPQAVSVHSHVRILLATLSSRQPTLRHIAIATLRHLIEKNPDLVINEKIEATLFHVLDDETDSQNGYLLRETILRLLNASCSSSLSHWILTCKTMILAASSGNSVPAARNMDNVSNHGPEYDSSVEIGEDDDNMVSHSNIDAPRGFVFEGPTRDKHLRYRTRVFAAECLSLLPSAAGSSPAHFDLSLARKKNDPGKKGSGDWLILHLQELISLAYQLSTIQFESMRPIGVRLLGTIVAKFARSLDPDLSGHLLLEQYQAQLVSALRTALDSSSGPVLLEAGLDLASKMMTSGILGSDQAAMKRVFSLINRPLNEFKEIYYPSYAEWVSCKIKIRLLTALASLKCYAYVVLQNHSNDSNEYLSLLPTFSKISNSLGKFWIGVLKDYCYLSLFLNNTKQWSPFLDGIQLPRTCLKVKPILEESLPLILQALALDAVPMSTESTQSAGLISGYTMVELDPEDYKFLWGFSFLVLFQNSRTNWPTLRFSLDRHSFGDSEGLEEEETNGHLKLYEVVLPVFRCLLGKMFFEADYLKLEICQDLLQVFSCSTNTDESWNSLAIPVLMQIMEHCPDEYFASEKFTFLSLELPLSYLLNSFRENHAPRSENADSLVSETFRVLGSVVGRFKSTKPMLSCVLALMTSGYSCIRSSASESCVSSAVDFLRRVHVYLSKCSEQEAARGSGLGSILGAVVCASSDLTTDCLKHVRLLERPNSKSSELLRQKLIFSLEETIALGVLAYRADCSEDRHPLYMACVGSVRTVLNHANLEVQAIGLHALKATLQRSTAAAEKAFLLFVAGELLVDIFTLVQNVLKEPSGKDFIAVLRESLTVLMLLQLLPQSEDSRKLLMNLLLHAVIAVVEAKEKDFSKEAADVKAVAVSVVSHVAQIPSSAVHFKDALVSLPANHKQLLQGLILASVKEGDHVTRGKAVPKPLEIKVAAQKESSPAEKGDAATGGDSDEEDDEWDAFQSFPAANNRSEVGTVSFDDRSSEQPSAAAEEDEAAECDQPSG